MRDTTIEQYQKGESPDNMMLRDVFALSAMQGIISGIPHMDEDSIVEKAYRLADNMLVYREQTRYV